MSSPTPAPDDGEAAPAVAVTRTIGGVLLVILGRALLLGGASWFLLVPWFGWATEGFWFGMAERSDLGGGATGILGFVLAVVGGALIQRARKKRFQVLVDASEPL